ncbi:MAG: beta-1,6-N-acetylglucosaminyltransferase, partial [Myroides sp.]|nr:beta-1,6-N-acetylglucosaminyltransferase [Myroides sp.]
AILFLCRKALKDQNNNYFHLISGQDFPTKSVDYYLNSNENFLQFEPLPTVNWNGNGGLNRYNYYNIFDCISLKNKSRLFKLNNGFIKIQKLLKISRKSLNEDFKTIYGGGTWWSLTREAVEYVALNKNSDIYLKRMRYCFCSEEIYFQSILLNSNLKQTIQNNNLRYIDWHSKRGGIPSFLDQTDFDEIVTNDYLFARKLNDKSSEQLKRMLINKNK